MVEPKFPLPREGEPDAFTLPSPDRPDPGLCRSVFVCDKNTEEEMVETLRAADIYAVDTEGTGLKIWVDKVIGICISVPPWTTGFYCPMFNGPEGGIWYRDRAVFDRRVGLFKGFLEDDKPKRFFNMLYDVPIIYCNFNIAVENVVEDVMLKMHALNPDSEHGLKESAVCYIDPLADWYETELHRYNVHVGGSPKKPRYWLIPPRIVAAYGGADAAFTGRLDDIVSPHVDPYARASYYNTTMKLAHALLNMRIDGVPVNREYLERGSIWAAAQMDDLAGQMREMIGDPDFNPGSSEQVSDVFYRRLGLPPGRKGKKGYSADEDERKRLKGTHPIIEKMDEYKTVEKQKGSYFDAIVNDLDEHDRFCPDPKINGTVLGRLSLNRLHQIPRGPLMRHAFVAGKGRKLIGGDYSQMDARVLAHLTRDPVLMEAFRNGHDIHAVTAKKMFHVSQPIEEIEGVCPVHGYVEYTCCPRHGEFRNKGKTINFALFTGETVWGLMKLLDCTKEEAQFFYDQFWQIYKAIPPWKRQFTAYSRSQRCVRTLYGRPRFIPGIEHSLDGYPWPPRYPDMRPSCYAKQARYGGLALSLRYDMGVQLGDWTRERAEAMRPLLASYDRQKCADCRFLWECYYTIDYRIEKRQTEEVDRQLISTVIQGSTADLVNDGVARTFEMCAQDGYLESIGVPEGEREWIHLFVHDESVYSLPDTANIAQFKKDLKRCYEAPGDVLTVPLLYDPKDGDTWAEVKYGSKVARYLPFE